MLSLTLFYFKILFSSTFSCETIGLFLISTRNCDSHEWKLLKCPICWRVQLITVSRTDRFPILRSYLSPTLLSCTMQYPLSFRSLSVSTDRYVFCTSHLLPSWWFFSTPERGNNNKAIKQTKNKWNKYKLSYECECN